MQNVKILVLSHPLGDLEVTCTVHLWLAGKRLVDFLLLFLLLLALMAASLRHYEAKSVEIGVFGNGGSL